MNRKPVSKSCMLFELMSMFEKLQTQSIKLKMNYDHLRKNPQKYVPDPKNLPCYNPQERYSVST